MFIIFHVLYLAFCLLSFLEEEFSIDGEKKELKKEENNSNGLSNEKSEREEKQSSDTPKVNISHVTHTYKLMVKSLELVNSPVMPKKHNDNALK